MPSKLLHRLFQVISLLDYMLYFPLFTAKTIVYHSVSHARFHSLIHSFPGAPRMRNQSLSLLLTFHVSLFDIEAVIAMSLHLLSISFVIFLSSPNRVRVSLARRSLRCRPPPLAWFRSNRPSPSWTSKHSLRDTA